MTSIHFILGFGLPGNFEWIILLVLGLLIFGRRLPEVGRSIGRSIVEFKRGIKGIDDEIEAESSRPALRDSKKATADDDVDLISGDIEKNEDIDHVVSER